MALTSAAFANYESRKAEFAAEFGPNWMSLQPYSTIGPDGRRVDKLTQPYQNRNRNNPLGLVLQAKPPFQATCWSDRGGDIPCGPYLYEQPIENPAQWDVNAFGNLADWNLTDTLPGIGQTVQEYIERLKSFDWGAPISSKAEESNFFVEALKSPGFGGVLAAAGIGQVLTVAAGAEAAGSAAASSEWVSGYDLAGGGALGGSSSGLTFGGVVDAISKVPTSLIKSVIGAVGAVAGADAAATTASSGGGQELSAADAAQQQRARDELAAAQKQLEELFANPAKIFGTPATEDAVSTAPDIAAITGANVSPTGETGATAQPIAGAGATVQAPAAATGSLMQNPLLILLALAAAVYFWK